MAINITFLGTSSMVPTKDRNHSSIYLDYKGEGILFDCGEGTQRQIKLAGIKPSKIKKIIISHWHGDHVLGLPGLLNTLGNGEYSGVLNIFGPIGSKEYIEHMTKSIIFDCKVQFKIHEIKKNGKIIDEEDYTVEAYELEHKVPCYGFCFIEKNRRRINTAYVNKLGIPQGPMLGRLQRGYDIEWKGEKILSKKATRTVYGKKLGIVWDTELCDNCYKIAKSVDLLISEATFSSKLDERAEKTKHLTAKEATLIANECNVDRLILTHLSQRYKTPQEVLEDARNYFDNVDIAYDFMKIKL